MSLLDYAYLHADEPTMRMHSVNPRVDKVELDYLQKLYALLSMPCLDGYIPFTNKTWAEQRAEFARDLLNDLEAYRQARHQAWLDSANKIQPTKKKRRWSVWKRGVLSVASPF